MTEIHTTHPANAAHAARHGTHPLLLLGSSLHFSNWLVNRLPVFTVFFSRAQSSAALSAATILRFVFG